MTYIGLLSHAILKGYASTAERMFDTVRMTMDVILRRKRPRLSSVGLVLGSSYPYSHIHLKAPRLPTPTSTIPVIVNDALCKMSKDNQSVRRVRRVLEDIRHQRVTCDPRLFLKTTYSFIERADVGWPEHKQLVHYEPLVEQKTHLPDADALLCHAQSPRRSVLTLVQTRNNALLRQVSRKCTSLVSELVLLYGSRNPHLRNILLCHLSSHIQSLLDVIGKPVSVRSNRKQWRESDGNKIVISLRNEVSKGRMVSIELITYYLKP